jgi:hypothetical protein
MKAFILCSTGFWADRVEGPSTVRRKQSVRKVLI